MREEIIQHEDGRTIKYYNDLDLCVKLIDEDLSGHVFTQIIYQYKNGEVKGWVELGGDSFIRSYIVDGLDRLKKVLVFDANGQLIEESNLD